jgi:hypothetical protein
MGRFTSPTRRAPKSATVGSTAIESAPGGAPG